MRVKCNYLEKEIKKNIDELDFLYPIVGKTLRDLPHDLKNVSSCWLLPDGRMFGGVGYAYIHLDILSALSETGFFGFDKLSKEPISKSEDEVEEMGWCKLSAGHGFMLYDKNDVRVMLTEEQKTRIIDWAIANDETTVEFDAHHYKLKDFAEMTAKEIMDPFDLHND